MKAFRRGTGAAWTAVLALVLARPSVSAAQQAAPGPIGEVQLFGEEDIKIEAATKTPIPISKAPGAVTVITARQIRESGARTVPELLRLVAGVNIRWNPMVQTIDIRGFGENPFTNRVLLLIDGVPYNDWNQGGFPQHPGLDFFIIQNIKRIEVVRGPRSALYGENALWGVINIITLSGDDLEGGRVQGYGGQRDTAAAGAFYGRRIGGSSVFVSARYLHGQLPMAFWTEENDSKWRGNDVFVKVSRKGLQASYYRHHDTMDGFTEVFPPEIGLPPGAAFKSAPEVGQTVDIAALKYERAAGKDATLTANASYARRFGTHCAACHAAREEPDFAIRENHGDQLLGDVRLDLRRIPHNDVLLGVEWRQVDRGDHKKELLEVPAALQKYRKLAAYLQDQVSLVGGRLRAVAGLRYDGETDLFRSKVSPRVDLVYNPTDPLVLRAGYGTAFRFPTFSELYQNTWFFNADVGPVAFPLAVFKPNPGLQPEEVRSFELGAEYRIRPELSAKLDLFRSRLKRFVVLGIDFPPPPALATVGFENHPDEATVEGAELELRWNLARRATGFVNWTVQSQDQKGSLRDSTGRPFEFVYAPKHKLNVASYLGPFGWVRGAVELGWRGRYLAPSAWGFIASGASDPAALFRTPTLDGYAILDVRVSYDLPLAVGKVERPLRLTLQGRNLLDKRPTETLVGTDTRLVGREVFAEVSFEFR